MCKSGRPCGTARQAAMGFCLCRAGRIVQGCVAQPSSAVPV